MRSIGYAALLMLTLTSFAGAQGKKYAVVKTLNIGGEGGWDYVTVDPATHRLYVTRSSHTQVIDSESGKILADIAGQKRSHGVAIVPDANRGFISDGGGNNGGGAIVIFDLKSNEVLGKIEAPADADGIIYDPASKHVLCVCGDEAKVVALAPDVDPKSGKVEALDLGGKPEFLAADGKGKAFINLEDKNEVAVVDTKAMKVLAKWPVTPGGSPVGMSMDREKKRLFIGCRNPQKMIVMDAESGKVLGDAAIGAGVDATQFDEGAGLASCRDGTLAVVRETSPGKFEVSQTVQTKPGARTMGLDPTTHMLYLPTAEYLPAANGQRPSAKPGSFMLLVVGQQ
jgi:DNA-binding beta-propeller fold protein YncE